MKRIKKIKRIILISFLMCFFIHSKSNAQKIIELFFKNGFDSTTLTHFQVNGVVVIDSVVLYSQSYPFDDISNVRLHFSHILRALYLVNTDESIPLVNTLIKLGNRGNTYSFWLDNEFYSFWADKRFDKIAIFDYRKNEKYLQITLDEFALLNRRKGFKINPKVIKIKANQYATVKYRPRARIRY